MTENLENPATDVETMKEIPKSLSSELFSSTYRDFQEKYSHNIQKEKKFIYISLLVILLSLILEIFSLLPVMTRPPPGPEFERYILDRKIVEFLVFLVIGVLMIYQMIIFNNWLKQSKENQNSIIKLTFKINNDSNKVIMTSIFVLIFNIFLVFTSFQEILKPPIPGMRPPPFEIMHFASAIIIVVFWIIEAILLYKWSKKYQSFNRMVQAIEKELEPELANLK